MSRCFAVLCLLSAVLSLSRAEGSETVEAVAPSRIETGDGTARFLLEGASVVPTMLFVNLHDRPQPKNTALMAGEIADAAKQGVSLLTFTVGFPWAKEGEKPAYQEEVDRWVDLALTVNPGARLVPRIPADAVPLWWQVANPGELTVFHNGQSSALPSPHSRRWREAAAAQLQPLIRHLEEKYGNRIAGYHLSGQNTGEWFSQKLHHSLLASCEPCAIAPFRDFLARKYGNDEALATAWNRPGGSLKTVFPPSAEERLRTGPPAFRPLPQERNIVDFLEFRNVEMAEALLSVCSVVKTTAPGKLVFAFYGYHLELSVGPGLQESGHLALAQLQRSPLIDVLCSPVSYMDRYGGGTAPFMSAIDSAALHGKMRFLEEDLRTHLSPPDSAEARINGHRAATDARETRGILTRNLGQAITHGAGLWWMDLWGEGWYRGEALWNELGKLRKAYADALGQNVTPPEIAVFVDDRSQLFLRAHASSVGNPQRILLNAFRADLFQIGAPVGFYTLDDLLAGEVPPAKLNLLLDAYSLGADRLAQLRQRISQSHSTFVFFWATGMERDGVLDARQVSEACGLSLQELPNRGGGKVRFERSDGIVPETALGADYDAGHGCLFPSFAVRDPAALTLANYTDGSGVALASKTVGTAQLVYSGILRLPPQVLSQLADQAGVHLYSRQNDVIAEGRGVVLLHATQSGERALCLPKPARLRDVLSGEEFGPGTLFRFSLEKGDSKLMQKLPE